MLGTALLFALVSAGIVIALQGFLLIRGRRRARVAFFERPLISALSLKKEAQVTRVLGRLRVVYGLFLVVVGVWGLAG